MWSRIKHLASVSGISRISQVSVVCRVSVRKQNGHVASTAGIRRPVYRFVFIIASSLSLE